MSVSKSDYTQAIQHIVREVKFPNGYGQGDGKIKPDVEAEISNKISTAMREEYFKSWLGSLMCYTGKRWAKIRITEDLPKIIYEVLRRKEVGIVYQMPSVVGKAVRVVEGDMNIREYRGDKKYISFRNCVLDMNTKERLEFSEKYESIVYLDFDYDPTAECPLWDKTLKQIIPDDASISALHEFLGVIFIDRDKLNIESMLWLIGTGGNGKGVVYDMIKNILGENCSSTEFHYLFTHNQAEYYRAGVAGKLLNFCSDMGTKEFSNGVFKKVTSHEPVECRHPGEKMFETREMPLLAASVNKMPIITDSTDGFWRRCKFILFPRTFTEKEQDKLLKFKLQSEISGVFNHILKGMDRLIANGGVFTESDAMKEIGKKARVDSNSTLSWCKEMRYKGIRQVEEDVANGVLNKKDYVEHKRFSVDMMQSYRKYCDDFGHMPKNRQNFAEDLKSEGFEYKDRMRLDSSVSSGFRFYEITKEEVFDRLAEEKIIDELPF